MIAEMVEECSKLFVFSGELSVVKVDDGSVQQKLVNKDQKLRTLKLKFFVMHHLNKKSVQPEY